MLSGKILLCCLEKDVVVVWKKTFELFVGIFSSLASQLFCSGLLTGWPGSAPTAAKEANKREEKFTKWWRRRVLPPGP